MKLGGIFFHLGLNVVLLVLEILGLFRRRVSRLSLLAGKTLARVGLVGDMGR